VDRRTTPLPMTLDDRVYKLLDIHIICV